MSDQPTQVPEWATNDTSTEVTEPSAADKLTGWVPDEQPAAQHMNWLQHRIYLWSKWLSEGIFQRSSLTDNTPVLQTCDRDARPRHYLGPEGYWMGPAIQEQHRWFPLDSGAFLANGDSVSDRMSVWTATDAVAIAVAGDDVSVDGVVCGAPKLVIRINNASVSERAVVFSTSGGSPQTPGGDSPIADLDNVVAVMEARVAFDVTPTAGVNFSFGFHSMEVTTAALLSSNASNAFAVFTVTNSADWGYAFSNGATGGGGALTTPVAVAADTWYTLRIEHHGKNTPVGVDNTTAAVNRFFIDGVLVEEETGSSVMQSTSGPVGPVFYGYSDVTGPAADAVMSVGTVKCAWNETLDFDVPA